MFASVGPSLASLGRSLSGLTLSSQQEVEEIGGIAEDLEDAEKDWKRIQALLADAEERQISNGPVRDWLEELRDVAYKIEDLRDVYEYEVVAREVEASKKALSSSGDASTSKRTTVDEPVVEVCPSSLSPLLDASFREQIARDLERIKKQFGAIAKRREDLKLNEEGGRKYSSNGIIRGKPASHLVVDPVFLGRVEELHQLRDLLIADHGDDRVTFQVICVIGMGGIGKSTLAQNVLMDPDIDKKFDKIGWVHVSEDCELTRLTKAVIETFSRKKSTFSQLSPLQDELTELIKDKKVLLVADDVWDTDGWESFVAPFHDGPSKGSKILVTTRLPEVANRTRAAKFFTLQTLSEQDGWSLLKEHAFRDQSADVDNFEELEEIGKRIAVKCGGLPLSIKVLGSLLSYMKNDVGEWRNVLENNLLELSAESDAKGKILGSLYLSYLYLSPQLRSCFKFCSKYPKNMILRKRLKQSWMAYDVVKDEAEATRCFNELVSRFFLEFNRSCGYAFMHDHIHDLAQYAQGEEHKNLQYDGAIFPAEVGEADFSGARHASISFRNIEYDDFSSPCHINANYANLRILKLDTRSASVKLSLSLGQYLRELQFNIAYMLKTMSSLEINSCGVFEDGLKCLRILNLPAEWTSIPAWVFQLYNLRYLRIYTPHLKCLSEDVIDLRNLRWLSIQDSRIEYLPDAISRLTKLQELSLEDSDIRCLPKTISELVNLHELNLRGCHNFEELPEGIVNLTNLRILNLLCTNVSFMPKGIGRLTKLQYMPDYVLDSEKAGLAELKNMKYLEDLIMIHNLCDVVSEEDAEQAELGKKRHLRKLFFRWSKFAYKGCSDMFDLISFNDSYQTILQNVLLHGRSERVNLPLEDGVALREEKVFERLRPHQNIEEVFISDYRGFKLPCWMGDECFIRLVNLWLYEINYCSSLSPIDQLPSLEKLIIENMDSLKELVPSRNIGHVDSDSMEQPLLFPKLKWLIIYHCNSLELLPLHKFASLKCVQVHVCLNLMHVELADSTPSPLKGVRIDGCPNLNLSPNPHFSTVTISDSADANDVFREWKERLLSRRDEMADEDIAHLLQLCFPPVPGRII